VIARLTRWLRATWSTPIDQAPDVPELTRLDALRGIIAGAVVETSEHCAGHRPAIKPSGRDRLRGPAHASFYVSLCEEPVDGAVFAAQYARPRKQRAHTAKVLPMRKQARA